MFDSEEVLMTVFAVVGKDLTSICIRCSSLLLELAALLGLDRASITAHILRAHLHISLHRALLLGAEQARVVFGEVLLLAMAHLTPHDDSWAQLDGLGLYEARIRKKIFLAI